MEKYFVISQHVVFVSWSSSWHVWPGQCHAGAAWHGARVRESGDIAHGQSSQILFITMTNIGLGTNGRRYQTDIFPLLPGRVHRDNDKWRMFGGGERIGSSSPDILHSFFQTDLWPTWIITGHCSPQLRAGPGLTKLISGLWDSQFTPQYLG